ncbi:MAG: hypothetical protein KIT83_09540, partial [Bryobacterales bacterium]|nr:hypothetical protein [Bryobacterales bacterium]
MRFATVVVTSSGWHFSANSIVPMLGTLASRFTRLDPFPSQTEAPRQRCNPPARTLAVETEPMP